MLRNVIFLSLLSFSSAERETTPVFIMDFEMILSHVHFDSNPFTKIQTSQFTTVIEEAIKRSKLVIIFVEERFCIEDVSLKDRQGTPYYHMRQGLIENKVKFLPAVYQPYKTLKQYFKSDVTNTFYLSDTSAKLKLYDGKFKYIYIYFQDSSQEPKAIALRRHDLLIREVYSTVRQQASSPIVAFYTGKMNPVTVETLNFVPIKPEKREKQPGVTIYSEGALFRLSGVYATSDSRRSVFSQIPMVAEETWQKQKLNTRMAYSDFELEFEFVFKEDGWSVDSVMLLEWGEEVGRTETNIGAPWQWSYVCSEPLVIVNLRDGSSVTISQYQIQPFQGRPWRSHTNTSATSGGNDTHSFGPAVNCGPYFNAHILSGLMVTFFCVAILLYGVFSMYNCKSNDRYDDQNAKPLTIAFEAGGH